MFFDGCIYKGLLKSIICEAEFLLISVGEAMNIPQSDEVSQGKMRILRNFSTEFEEKQGANF